VADEAKQAEISIMALLNHYQSRNNPTFFEVLQGQNYEEPESDPEIESDAGFDFE
jgi:hypothetical protein